MKAVICLLGLTLGSLFDGSGGFPLAGALNGIMPVWASEIEPFPIRVTTKRLPGMKHYGDVQKLNGANLEPVDIITFGSPCQDMSIAGKRAGIMDGKRSNLFFEAIRIIREMREATDGQYPRYAVWENVPGAFSSNRGEDFRSVLQSFIDIGQDEAAKAADERQVVLLGKPEKWTGAGEIVGDGYSVAWRTLDAQFWGVPQRRRRIYLVADFGSGCAGEILFERKGLSGDSQPSEPSWEAITADAPGSAGGSCGVGDVAAFSGGQGAKAGSNVRCLNPWDCQSKRVFLPNGVYPTLPAMDCGGANNQAVIYPDVTRSLCARADSSPCVDRGQPFCVYSLDSLSSNSMKSANPHSGCHETSVARCLDTSDANPGKNQGGNVIIHKYSNVYDARGNGDGVCCPTLTGDHENRITDYTAIALQGNCVDHPDTANCNGCGWHEDISYTLNTFDRHAVCAPELSHRLTATNARNTESAQTPNCIAIDCRNDRTTEVSETLQAKANGGHSLNYQNPVCIGNGCTNQIVMSDKCNTWDCMHDQKAVITAGKPPRRYIVRRLMPVECAKLQGFPDWWCADLQTPDPTDAEIAQWVGIWGVWADLNGTKPKSRAAVIKWLRQPYSDSAEYKLWGNGIALPCAAFVLKGVATQYNICSKLAN